jgi:glycosyltransferase involved in cell wall biosynthesis
VTDQKKLARIYSSSDFFVSASYQECFAQVHLESMSCGTPVISTPCGGSFDAIKPFNGIVCEGFDVPALAKGISEALSKKYDSRQIRDYCVSKYDYAIIAKKYEDMYHSILKA